MRIDKPGRYELLADVKTRNAISIGRLPKGTILEIRQIDAERNKVVGPPLLDWTYWELPAKRVGDL